MSHTEQPGGEDGGSRTAPERRLAAGGTLPAQEALQGHVFGARVAAFTFMSV